METGELIGEPIGCDQVDLQEKFMAPLLSFQVGAGNQMIEYISGAVIARALNRTYCVAPFFPGPSRHNGKHSRDDFRNCAIKTIFIRIAVFTVPIVFSACNTHAYLAHVYDLSYCHDTYIGK